MPCESDSGPVSVCHPGVTRVTQNRTLHGSERGREWAAMACGIHVGSAPASAADRQREDRRHSVVEEKCAIWPEMLSGPSASGYEAASVLRTL